MKGVYWKSAGKSAKDMEHKGKLAIMAVRSLSKGLGKAKHIGMLEDPGFEEPAAAAIGDDFETLSRSYSAVG